MNDQDIKDFFRSSGPQITDGDAFMEELSSRMETAVRIRNIREDASRRYRRVILRTFVIGSLAGAAVIMFLLPEFPSIFGHDVTVFTSFTGESKSVVCAVVSVVALVFGLLPARKLLSFS